VLGDCALHLAPTLSLSVQVRRALVPPLDVKHVLLCRCHGTPVAFNAGAAYCVQTTQLDRFDVLEALQVGGMLFAAPTEAPSAAAFCEALVAWRGALQCESIDDGDPAFARWRNEAALAALMQASPLVARRTSPPAPSLEPSRKTQLKLSFASLML
jgi:hypothetical protein